MSFACRLVWRSCTGATESAVIRELLGESQKFISVVQLKTDPGNNAKRDA
jgi:hypothetical protein